MNPSADLNKAELPPAESSSHRGERGEPEQHVEEEAQDPQHIEGVRAPRLRLVKVKRGGFVVPYLRRDGKRSGQLCEICPPRETCALIKLPCGDGVETAGGRTRWPYLIHHAGHEVVFDVVADGDDECIDGVK